MAAPDDLFDRRVTVTVDTIQFSDLDCTFTVEKTLKPAPNNCELSIWNLSRDHRAQLEQLRPKDKKATTGIPCKIEAGYRSGTSLIWLGDLRSVENQRQGPDWITKLSSGDGERGSQKGRLHISYGPGTDIGTALRAMARAMGVSEGNLSQVVSKLKIAGSAIFPSGITISGPVYRQLQTFAQSADLELTIQDSALQFVDRGATLAGTALKLSAATGMLDSPSVDNKGILTVKTLMIPNVRVGGLIVMDALSVKGNFKIQKATWTGDTAGGDWMIEIQGKAF